MCSKLKGTASHTFTPLARGQFHSITVPYRGRKTSFVAANDKLTRRKNKAKNSL